MTDCGQGPCRPGQWTVEIIGHEPIQVKRCVICGKIIATASIPRESK